MLDVVFPSSFPSIIQSIRQDRLSIDFFDYRMVLQFPTLWNALVVGAVDVPWVRTLFGRFPEKKETPIFSAQFTPFLHQDLPRLIPLVEL